MKNYKKKNRNPKRNHQKGLPTGSKRVKVSCIGIDEEGKGIIDIKGQRVSVPYLIEGETALVDVIRKRSFTTAKVHQIETKSRDRIAPKCQHFHQCGGCQLQHMSYRAQSNYKEELVEGLMGCYGKVNKIITMKHPYNYRNKIHSTLSYGKNKEIVSGIYEQYSHRVIPIDRCIIQDPCADEIIKTIRELMKSFKMRPFDEDTGQGFLRHILVKTGFTSRQIMVVLVVSKPIFPSKNNFVKALLKKHPEITTIVMNVNSRRTSVVLGNTEKVLYGKGTIEDTLCGHVFQISPKSFYQINPIQTEKLYNKAIEMAELRENEVVFDAYCGIGTIALILSSKVKKVIGVELNKDAVQDAIKNAKRNKIKNVRFYQGDAGEFISQMAEAKERIDTLFMDPPRSGSDEKFLSSIVKLKPKKVVYISCNPVTQARDLEYLTKHGYRVEEIQPVDMFPHTTHVEVVTLIEKK